MSWTPTPVQRFVTIRPGVSFLRMRDFAHQNRVSFFWVLATLYSQGPWTDFDAKYDKTCGSAQGCAFSGSEQNGMSARARPTWQKLQIFKIQNGGRPPCWKSLNRHISVKNRPILMKFGTLHQILNPITVTWPKIEIAFLAITLRPIVRFQRNFVWGSRTVCRRGLHDKNYKFLKSSMADCRHFENR